MTDIFEFEGDDKETMADEVFYDEEKEISEDDFEEEFEETFDSKVQEYKGADSQIAHHGVTRAEFSGSDEDDEVSEELLAKTETSEAGP